MADTPMDLDDDDDGPTRQRPSDTAVSGMTTTKVILIAVVGVMLLGCCGVGGCVALLGVGSKRVADRETKEVAEGSALTFTADALHGEYDANEVAADGKYKGKTVEVTGTVKEIAYLGDVSRYLVALDSGKLVRVTQPNTDRRDDRVTWEERVWLAWSPGANVVVTQ